MRVTTVQVSEWLESCGGEASADNLGVDVVSILCDRFKIRRSDAGELRALVCEMAARGVFRLAFADNQLGDAPIVGIAFADDTSADYVADLRRRLQTAYDEKAQVQEALTKASGDAGAAMQLADEALAEKAVAESRLADLQGEYERLSAELSEARNQKPVELSPAAIAKREQDIGRAVRIARERVRLAEATVETLNERLSAARRFIRGSKTGYNFYTMTCGCVIARTDVSRCEYGGRSHPIFPMMVPKLSYADAKRYISYVLSEAMARFSGEDTVLVLSTDIRGRTMP